MSSKPEWCCQQMQLSYNHPLGDSLHSLPGKERKHTPPVHLKDLNQALDESRLQETNHRGMSTEF